MLSEAFDTGASVPLRRRPRHLRRRSMTPVEIVAKLAHYLNNFEPIDRQPSDIDLTRLHETSRVRRSSPTSDPVWQNGSRPQPHWPYLDGGYLRCSLQRGVPRSHKIWGLQCNYRQRRYGHRPCALRGVPQGKARQLRYVWNGKTGDNTVCTRRRCQHLGLWIAQLWVAIHRGRSQGYIFTPPSGVHRPARPWPLGAA